MCVCVFLGNSLLCHVSTRNASFFHRILCWFARKTGYVSGFLVGNWSGHRRYGRPTMEFRYIPGMNGNGWAISRAYLLVYYYWRDEESEREYKKLAQLLHHHLRISLNHPIQLDHCRMMKVETNEYPYWHNESTSIPTSTRNWSILIAFETKVFECLPPSAILFYCLTIFMTKRWMNIVSRVCVSMRINYAIDSFLWMNEL